MSSNQTYTIEFVPKYAEKARTRFSTSYASLGIEIIIGDSATELKKLLASIPSSVTILAYLDAHWEKDLPTSRELIHLRSWGAGWVAIIDDFKVPEDDSYGFDQYGELVVDSTLIPSGLRLLVPSQSAHSEFGARRGTGYVFGQAFSNHNLTELFPDLREIPLA
jgi:hypothetical protein